MKFNKALPSNTLKFYVKGYWLMERPFENIKETLFVLPNEAVEIIFHLKKPFVRIKDGLESHEPFAFLEGQQSSSIKLIQNSEIRTFAITLYPWGVKKFFGYQAYSFTNCNYAISEIDMNLNELLDGIMSSHSFEDMVKVSNDYLEKLLAATSNELSLFDSTFIKSYLQNSFFNPAYEFGVSKRYSEMKSKELLGIPLGTSQRKERVKAVVRMLLTHNDISFRDVIGRYGYFDQSHFSNEMKKYFNMSPSSIQENKEVFLEDFF